MELKGSYGIASFAGKVKDMDNYLKEIRDAAMQTNKDKTEK